MGQLAVLGTNGRPPGADASSRVKLLRFRPILISEVGPTRRRLATPVTGSLVGHALTIGALVAAPLLFYEMQLPSPAGAITAFFVEPQPIAPPPPPPPPPPKRRQASKPRPQPRVKKPLLAAEAPPRFVAPIAIPEELPVDDEFDFGIDVGVEGGVEGGVPGGVIGGVIGGLPEPPPPPKPVRVGGSIKQPTLIKRVSPEYPMLAQLARVSGIVIIEAHVGVDGRVKNASVLRGPALLEEPAVAAVRQWRYAPLLLNGIPTEFLLTVVVNFQLALPGTTSSGASPNGPRRSGAAGANGPDGG